jgi:uncharacterized protein
MTTWAWRRAALVAIGCALALAAVAQIAVPALTARVTDLTGTLTAQQRAALEERLAAFEASKGSQIAVLIVPTTQPETIEQFGIRVGDAWKVGRKGVDDGAILLIALKDRALRIETGYGLEGVLPDAVARRIIDEHIVPRFKQGDYFGGIDAGLTRMMSVIEGEPLPPPRGTARPRAGEGGGGLQELLVIGFLLVFVVGGIVRAIFGRVAGSGLIGLMGGFAGWLMLGSLIAGVAVGIVALFLSMMGGLGGGSRLGRRGGWYGGFPGGGGWSGRGGWGGGGGGGWGGGGGGFGGGGASGRW